MKAKYKICSIVKFTVLAEFSWEAWSVVYPFMLCTSCVSCVPLTKLEVSSLILFKIILPTTGHILKDNSSSSTICQLTKVPHHIWEFVPISFPDAGIFPGFS